MAQALANGMILSARIVCAAGDQIGVNVLWYVVSGVSGAPHLDSEVATALDNALAVPYKTWLTVNANYRGVGVSIVKPVRFVEVIGNAGAGAGTTAGDMLPRQISGLISFLTPNAGHQYRGRIYPPFLPRTYTDANGKALALLATNLAGIRAAIPNLITLGAIPNVTNLQHVIYHRKTNTTTPVNFYLSHTLTATQRRRGDEGRTNVTPF